MSTRRAAFKAYASPGLKGARLSPVAAPPYD